MGFATKGAIGLGVSGHWLFSLGQALAASLAGERRSSFTRRRLQGAWGGHNQALDFLKGQHVNTVCQPISRILLDMAVIQPPINFFKSGRKVARATRKYWEYKTMRASGKLETTKVAD